MNANRTTAALLAAVAVSTLTFASNGVAEETATNRPPLVSLRPKDRLLAGEWTWHRYQRKQPAGAAAEFPDVKYNPWSVETRAPRSTLVGPLYQGSRVRIVGGKGPDHGMADVLVDGKLMATFDAYGPTQVCDQVLCEVTGLDPVASHDVRVVTKQQKNPKSTGYRVIIEDIQAEKVSDFVKKYAQDSRDELARIVAGEKPYLKPEQWKPVAYKASAAINGVTLDGGPLRQSMDTNIGYLNRCFSQFRNTTNLHSWGAWDASLPGSGDGKMLGGAGNTLRWGERTDMREIVDHTVSMSKRRQRPDGYCMNFPEENFKVDPDAFVDERRNYARSHWSIGMAAAALAGNPDALPVMRRFYDWFNASPYYPTLLKGVHDEMMSSHNCNNGNEGGLQMYFSAQGKPEDLLMVQRYLVQDFHIAATRTGNPYSLSRYPGHVPHSYVLLAYKAWLDLYRGTGDAKYLDGALGAWDIVHNHFLNHGSITICEGDRSPPDMLWIRHSNCMLEKHRGRNHPNETCGSVFWTDINHRFLQFFPEEAKYADDMESAIFNAVLASQGTNGTIRYHNIQVGQKEEPREFNSCCEVNTSPMIGALPQYLYSVASDGVYVNIYAPSSITTKQMTLKTTTDYPANGKVEIKVEGNGKLRLRIPGWVSSDPAGSGAGVPVNVNGKLAATGKPGSYVTLDKPAGTVSFELPMRFRTVLYTGADQNPDHDMYALLYGPVLMALVGADDLDIAAKDLPGKLKPVEGKPLQFSVAGKEGVHYQPYWQIQTETFTCFPTMR